MTLPYCKIADSVIDAGLGPYAGWLYTVITSHIIRKLNKLEATIKELAAWAGMSTRSVMRYTKVLEDKKLLSVKRSQTSEIADKNIYSLLGEAGQIALFNGVPDSHSPSDSQSQRHMPQSHSKDSNTKENTPNDGVCVPAWVMQEIKSFEGLSPEWPIKTYGAAQVLAVVRYAKRNTLHIGWVITELRDNRMGLQPADISQPQAEWNPPSPELPDDDDAQDQPYEKSNADDTNPDGFFEEDDPANQTPDIDVDPNVRQWETTLHQLEAQLGYQQSMWFRAVTYSHTDGGVWVMRCPSTARDMLQHRLYREIRRVLRDVRGERVELRFEVDEAVQHG